MLMGSITITISVEKLGVLAFAVVVIALSAWVLATDHGASYTWILPLDSAQSITGYWKTSTAIGVYDLGLENANYSNTVIVSGLFSQVFIDRVETGYAIVVAKGFNPYVLLITLAVLANTVLAVARRLKGARPSGLPLDLIILTLLASVTLLSLIPYISEGHTLGYSVYEYPVREYFFRDLPYNQLSSNSSLQLGFYRFAYNITVTNVPGGSLVRVWFTPGNDTVLIPTLIYIEEEGTGNATRLLVSNNNEVYTAFYVSGSRGVATGVLKILVFSEKQLNSSAIGYYVLSFYDGKTHSSITGFTLPAVFTLVLTVFNALPSRTWLRTRSERNA